jgi:hypothetical protein
VWEIIDSCAGLCIDTPYMLFIYWRVLYRVVMMPSSLGIVRLRSMRYRAHSTTKHVALHCVITCTSGAIESRPDNKHVVISTDYLKHSETWRAHSAPLRRQPAVTSAFCGLPLRPTNPPPAARATGSSRLPPPEPKTSLRAFPRLRLQLPGPRWPSMRMH